MVKIDSQREEGERERGRVSRRERKRENALTLGKVPGRFCRVLVESREFQMERAVLGCYGY